MMDGLAMHQPQYSRGQQEKRSVIKMTWLRKPGLPMPGFADQRSDRVLQNLLDVFFIRETETGPGIHDLAITVDQVFIEVPAREANFFAKLLE